MDVFPLLPLQRVCSCGASGADVGACRAGATGGAGGVVEGAVAWWAPGFDLVNSRVINRILLRGAKKVSLAS